MNDPELDLIAAARLDPFLDPFSRTAQVGAIALGLAALVVVMLTVFVTSRLTGSLGHLAAAADRVAAGDLDTHIDANSTDEVGRVARAFNGMIDNLRRMMRELSQREAVAAMGDLAATLAHQLRSPATAIRIDVQRTHDRLPPESTERALLARSLGQLDRLERAIAGSLKVARSAGAEFQDVDLRRPLERAIASTRRETAGRSLRIEDGGAQTEPLIVRGDDASLEQLFVNLLTNAAQAVEDNGTIVVTADEDGPGRVSVSIRDDGPGMTADVLARAGERLFSTKPEGTGLGLVIAKRIAEAHSGLLVLTSSPRSGTTAQVVLPRTR